MGVGGALAKIWSSVIGQATEGEPRPGPWLHAGRRSPVVFSQPNEDRVP
jgi:hypothetical protein